MVEDSAPPPPPPAQIPFIERVGNGVRALKQELHVLSTKAKNLEDTNFSLGNHHLVQGNARDAQFRFWFVTKLNRKNTAAWIGLAKAYIALEEPQKAKNALQAAIKLEPQNTEAKMLLTNVLKPSAPPQP